MLAADSRDFVDDISDDVQEAGVVRSLAGCENCHGSVSIILLLGKFRHASEQTVSQGIPEQRWGGCRIEVV